MAVLNSSYSLHAFGRICSLPMFVCLQLLMFGPNQYFAEKALSSPDYTYRASAVAKGHVTVLCASREDFAAVCNLKA